jgi:hypothetical protein
MSVSLRQPGKFPWPPIAPAEIEDYDFNDWSSGTAIFRDGEERGVGFSMRATAGIAAATISMELKPAVAPPEKRAVTLVLRAAKTGLISQPMSVAQDHPLLAGGVRFQTGEGAYQVCTVRPLSEVSWASIAGGVSRFPAQKHQWFPLSWHLRCCEGFYPEADEEWSFLLSRVKQEADDLPGALMIRNIRFLWL